MTAETFFSDKLRRFNLIEYFLVMMVYLIVSLLVISFYTKLTKIDWWFYLILTFLSAFPLIVHLFSQTGINLKSKLQSCIKSNTPALQVLLFLTVFFIACMLAILLPILIRGDWWIYLIIIIILAIKPLQKTWFW